jgi:hypothetical protein
MQDADLSDAYLNELGEIIAGTKPYDDRKFGKLVENNRLAIETMMLGASFSECDWGLAPLHEKFGWQTPVPYFWRSRALGRLDILYVLNAWGQGDQARAVSALAAGMKFARHVSGAGPLVPALIAKMLLLQQLSVADRLLDSGEVTSGEKAALNAALADLGTDGVDWQAAVAAEMKGMRLDLDHLRSAPDQRQYYKLMWNKDAPADFHGVTQQDYGDVSKIASSYASVFRSDDSQSVQRAISAATPTVRMMIPNPEKVLKSREELKKALEETKAKLR